MNAKTNFFQLCILAITIFLVLATRQQYENKLVPEQSSISVFIPEAASVKLLSLGFEQLLADIYWLAFMQYVGDNDARIKDQYARSYDYANLVTGLDPKFVGAYFFAAFLIGSEQKNPARAAEIIERGILANPDEWSLPFIAGINQYLFAHDEVKAAKYYRIASKYPSAPNWLERQANILEAKIPSKIKEINVWDTIYNASDGAVKDRARRKLAKLWVQVYRTSPSGEIKKRALTQLNHLGVDNLSLPLEP